MMPQQHASFLEHAVSELKADERIVGIAIGGSFITGTMDAFSDIDFVLVVDPAAIDEVMQDRRKIASRLGYLVDAFTGDFARRVGNEMMFQNQDPLEFQDQDPAGSPGSNIQKTGLR